jgi:hypothetical protein
MKREKVYWVAALALVWGFAGGALAAMGHVAFLAPEFWVMMAVMVMAAHLESRRPA